MTIHVCSRNYCVQTKCVVVLWTAEGHIACLSHNFNDSMHFRLKWNTNSQKDQYLFQGCRTFWWSWRNFIDDETNGITNVDSETVYGFLSLSQPKTNLLKRLKNSSQNIVTDTIEFGICCCQIHEIKSNYTISEISVEKAALQILDTVIIEKEVMRTNI